MFNDMFTKADFKQLNNNYIANNICEILNAFCKEQNRWSESNSVFIQENKSKLISAVNIIARNTTAKRAEYAVMLALCASKSTYYGGYYCEAKTPEYILVMPKATAFLNSIPDDELMHKIKIRDYYNMLFRKLDKALSHVNAETCLQRPIEFLDGIMLIDCMRVSKYGKTTKTMLNLYDAVWRESNGDNKLFTYFTDLMKRAESNEIKIDTHALNIRTLKENEGYPNEMLDEIMRGSTALVNADDYNSKAIRIKQLYDADDAFNNAFRMTAWNGLKTNCNADFILKHYNILDSMESLHEEFIQDMPVLKSHDDDFLMFNENCMDQFTLMIIPSGKRTPTMYLKTLSSCFHDKQSVRMMAAFTWMRIIMMLHIGTIEHDSNTDDMKSFESWMNDKVIPTSWNGNDLTDDAHDFMNTMMSTDDSPAVIIRKMTDGMNGLEKKLMQHMISND